MCYPLVPLSSSDIMQDIVDLNQSPEHDADLNEEDCVCRETENGMKLSC